jgi:hypothetical protein
MIYLKSLFIGALTCVISIVGYIVIVIWFTMRHYTPPAGSGGELGFDLRSITFHGGPVFWIVAVLGFALGFALTFSYGGAGQAG